MGFRLPSVVSAKQLLRRSSSNGNQKGSALVADVPKRYLAVYVGAESNTKRFVITVSFLNQPSFQELLNQVEEANGFDHPIMGGLTIPCTEDSFIDLISRLNT